MNIEKSFDDVSEIRMAVPFVEVNGEIMYAADDGNTEVFYLKNATATFSSFTAAPEVEKF